ncbi:MAG TPA: hypothetical protein VHW65_10155 [Gemmatimonadales bacterium]|jgi:hypothetical protein|nr:hypothetical protein [Gemmatimonadales bacterium]
MRAFASLAVVVSVTACAGGLSVPPVPAGQRPATEAQVATWVAATRPTRNEKIYMHFRVDNGNGAAGGHGTVSVAPPDSIAFGFAGPLGARNGAGVVLGDSLAWGVPEEDVRNIVPNYPLFWAMLGVARPPAAGSTLTGLDDAKVRAWRYVRGRDTVDYVQTRSGIPEFYAYVRQNGKPLGRVVARLDASGQVISARLVILTTPYKLDITFDSVKYIPSFPKDTWNAPRDQ